MPQWMNDVFAILTAISSKVTKEWPRELPPDSDPKFWEIATRMEFKYRATVTQKIRRVLSGDVKSCSTWTPIESWLYQKRVEWTMQFLFEACSSPELLTQPQSPISLLLKIMCDDWAKQGAVGFFDHSMMRDGKPHPDADEDVVRLMS